jgi:DNA replication and repair protein RecF
MYLSHLSLQNFRSYQKASFPFDQGVTVIVGQNTAGKTNILEAIWFLSNGKSFRSEKDILAIKFDEEMARVKGKIIGEGDGKTILETILTVGQVLQIKTPNRRYLVNDVPKRRIDFAGKLPAVIFAPADLDIIVGSPSLRRNFLDEALEQVSSEYRNAFLKYTKALRKRNALLEYMRDLGVRNEKQLSYWDTMLITHGQQITKMREEFIEFVNSAKKDVFALEVVYDHSIVSKERLTQYKVQELASGNTLVGPHRDDFQVMMGKEQSVRSFGSRGQQRLAILQLKFLQIAYIEKVLGMRPILLLDDVFSELDDNHMRVVMGIFDKQQTIITTTHKEFISGKEVVDAAMIELPLSRREKGGSK